LAVLPESYHSSLNVAWRYLNEWCAELGMVLPQPVTTIANEDDSLTFMAVAWLYQLPMETRANIFRHRVWGEDLLRETMESSEHITVKQTRGWALRYLLDRAGDSVWMLPVTPGGSIRALEEDHRFILEQAQSLREEWHRRRDPAFKDARGVAIRALIEAVAPMAAAVDDYEEPDEDDDV